MNSIEICEYEDKYASSLAEMWNKSSENWGGYDHIITTETIINEHKNSDHINTYLAIDKSNETVVGYCGLSEYKNDEGALYIPLLNVRPDYQGKKIGKQLVLKTVERTIELDWPRLDLYTWAGNTKAVPLYKKCGFFWEKRDDTVHLMNFIPTVLQSELLAEYFAKIDWYKDSEREIAIEPDGHKENDFNYYKYVWNLNKGKLKVVFERLGRGIRKIETPDFLIESEIDDYKLAYGNNYKIRYKVVNKSDNELNIKISGKKHKNIDFAYMKKDQVDDKKVFEGNFYLNEIKNKYSEDQTHPAVRADIEINGKKVEFKQGIKTEFPADLKLNVPLGRKYEKTNNKLYLEIKNNYQKQANFKFTLPSTDDLIFSKNEFDVKLNSGEKRSIVVDYYLLRSCVYSKEIDIKAFVKGADEVTEKNFSARVTALFKGSKRKFGGELNKGWILANGPHTVMLEKKNNQLKYLDYDGESKESFFIHPRLGKPFSHEFSKKEADKVEFYKSEDAYCMRAIYISNEYPDIHLISVIKLMDDGMLENYYEIYNLGEEKFSDMVLSHSFYYKLSNTYLPYQNKVVKNDGFDSTDFDYWNTDDFTENWFFSADKVSSNRAIIWPEGKKINFNGWYMSIDFEIDDLVQGESFKSDSLYLAPDVFEEWGKLRQFASNDSELEKIEEENKFSLEINNDNPFVENEISISVNENRNKSLKGNLKFSSKNNFIENKKVELVDENNMTINLNVENNFRSEILKTEVDLYSEKFNRENIVFYKNNESKIVSTKFRDKKLDVYEVENGILKFRAAPEFSHSLYSLKYNNEEWLDNSFPEKTPKAWWNPWAGGVDVRPKKLRTSTLFEEGCKADFVKLTDNKGNEWQGLKTEINIKNNDDFKGTVLNHYYLTLPGIPLLCSTANIEQNTNRYFNREKFIREFYFKLANNLKDSYFTIRNSNEDKIKYKAGRAGREINSSKPIIYGSKEREIKLQIFNTSSSDYFAYTGLEVITSMIVNNISLETGDNTFIPPVFLIFTDNYLPKNLLTNLSKIKF